MQQVVPALDLFTTRFNNYIFCVSSTETPGLGSGRTQPAMGGPGPLYLPTGSHLGKSCAEVAGLPMQENHFDCFRVDHYALVLASSGQGEPDSLVPAQPAQTALQSDSSH